MARRLLVSVIVLAMLSVAALAAIKILFPSHWRVVATEQKILSPWLRPAFMGDGQSAENLLLCYPKGLEINASGEVLISDRGRERRGRIIWRIDAQGIAHRYAGTGLKGKAVEPLATELRLDRPEGLALAGDGSVFFSDGYNHSVFRVDTAGHVTRVAGTGVPGYSGDGGKAAEAQLHRPADIRFDSSGNLYIADVRNHRVRKIDTTGHITTVAGMGEQGYSDDGTTAVNARLDTPWAIGLDLLERVLIADSANHVVRRIDHDGTLVTVAGTGTPGYSGDGETAGSAELNYPEGLYTDQQGRLYIADAWNNAVRVVEANGIITTLIGTGVPGKAAIGAVAAGAPLDDPGAIVVGAGGVMISDGDNGRVIRIDSAGKIQLVAGRGDVSRCTSLW